MTVKAIRLENFMAFADTGWIELRPITLLFGRNSSGKSAIIRALRLLRQNLEQPTDDRYTLRLNSEYGVELGDYKETVHGKETERVMRFHFRCDVPAAADAVRREINQWRQQNDLPEIGATREDALTLALAFGYDPHREAELVGIDVSCNWQITAEPGSHTLLSAIWLDRETREEVGYNWWLDTDLPAWQALDWQRTSFTFPQNFLPQLADSPTGVLPNALGNLAQSITTFLEGIEYQPPSRPEPQRVYIFDNITREHRQQQGWNAFPDFLEGGNADDEKLVQIDRWLQTLDLGEQIAPPARRIVRPAYPAIDERKDEKVEYDVTVAKVEIKDKDNGLLINLKNTGYGASQVIPIIVQSVTPQFKRVNQQPNLVVIEQPELHLHAKAQGVLADFFISQIGNQQGKQFLLETHSEHLLLRFQRRIAETRYQEIRPDKEEKPPPPPANDSYTLEPKNFGLIFVTRSTKNSTIEFIEADLYGQLVEPSQAFQDFFRYDYDDVENLMNNVAKIRKQESANDNND